MNAPNDPTNTPEIKALEDAHAAAQRAARDAQVAHQDACQKARFDALADTGITLSETPITPWTKRWTGVGDTYALQPIKKAEPYAVIGVSVSGYRVAKITKSGAPSKAGNGIWAAVLAVTKYEGGAA